MSQSQILFRLQQIDTQLDQARARTAEIQRALASNIELQQAEAEFKSAQVELEITQQSLQDAELCVHEQCLKIEQCEAALYGGKIRIPKELQDLQNEVSALKRYLIKLEDHQLECMIAVEAAQLQEKNTKQILNGVEAAWAETTAHMQHELTQINAVISRLEFEHAAAISPIPVELLELYETLRKQRNGVAVTKISGKSCTACGTTLTPAVIQSIQSSPTIIRCPTCNRILYPG